MKCGAWIPVRKQKKVRRVGAGDDNSLLPLHKLNLILALTAQLGSSHPFDHLSHWQDC